MQFKQIVFPFDGSERCRSVAPLVKNWVRHCDAHLKLVSVVEDPASGFPSSAAFLIPPAERDDLVSTARRCLEKYAREAFPGERVEVVCRMGDPAKEILHTAEECNAHLIMMPARGGSHLRGLLLGSVTAKVLDGAKCPVWTQAHVEHEHESAKAGIRSIVCALDGKKENVWMIRAASDLAGSYSASLHLANAIPEVHVSSKSEARHLEREMEEQMRLRINELRDESGADADIFVAHGNPSHVVRKVALECNADLIVIGRGTVHGLLGRLRTGAYGIIRDAPCPVLSI